MQALKFMIISKFKARIGLKQLKILFDDYKKNNKLKIIHNFLILL